jgi:hypothetical protein
VLRMLTPQLRCYDGPSEDVCTVSGCLAAPIPALQPASAMAHGVAIAFHALGDYVLHCRVDSSELASLPISVLE